MGSLCLGSGRLWPVNAADLLRRLALGYLIEGPCFPIDLLERRGQRCRISVVLHKGLQGELKARWLRLVRSRLHL